MAHIILTGATGTCGSAVLAHLLTSPSISHISILSRRPVALASHEPKARVIIHKDYETYPPELLAQLQGATGVIWAQGISSAGMNETDYSKITVDYPVAAAKAFARIPQLGSGEGKGKGKGNGQLNFVYVSGEGADTAEKSRIMFGRVKGRAENALLAAQAQNPGLNVYNARPAFIWSEKGNLAEKPRGWRNRLERLLGPPVAYLMPSQVIPTHRLAEALTILATGDGEPVPSGQGVEADGRVLRNTALRRLAGM